MVNEINLPEYKTIVFDCDGVVLNSNAVKTAAFYEAAKHYGVDYATALVDYHVSHGGISRYSKFQYFLENILGQNSPNADELNDLLDRFALAVKSGLMACEVVEGLPELRAATASSNWLIVSGGDQKELREVFEAKGMAKYFDGGIFGSPDPKNLILERELGRGNIKRPALFLGDSKYDAEAALDAGLDFVFISQWTEVVGWREWVRNESYNQCSQIGALCQ
ncbi:phosphoglycolate phosphatase-like HAD superfamily hydrolase [Zhongshania antarctica]|uniref:phosphoglycolate phosphatase n=1 Tax=Zhongshania antarctica TaxID=641702 RepID=A0A840R5E4_9GAMM|nr:HAD family hydrolase [Zhongshania antarctica]MBB5187723.1 phosphoglycolate phosphatase-like HAD superfamily hydrolase [Zhongshania antarctica]